MNTVHARTSKAWTAQHSIAEPTAIAALEKDGRGYPIPAFATRYPDGRADFKIVDPEAWTLSVTKRRCGICGGKISGLFAFVGGPLSTKNRSYLDAGMHKDCAEYALKVCPFMAAPKFAYDRSIEGMPELHTERPEKFGLSMTSSYQPEQLRSGAVVLRIAPPVSLTWWKFGEKVS